MVFSRLSTDVQRQMADLQIPNAQHTMDPTRFSFSLTEGARFTAIIRRKGPVCWGKGISATAISFCRCKNSVGKKTSVNRQWIAMERDFSVIHVSSTSYVRVLPPKFQTALVRHSQTLDVFDDPPKKAILMGKWDQNPGDVHKTGPSCTRWNRRRRNHFWWQSKWLIWMPTFSKISTYICRRISQHRKGLRWHVRFAKDRPKPTLAQQRLLKNCGRTLPVVLGSGTVLRQIPNSLNFHKLSSDSWGSCVLVAPPRLCRPALKHCDVWGGSGKTRHGIGFSYHWRSTLSALPESWAERNAPAYFWNAQQPLQKKVMDYWRGMSRFWRFFIKIPFNAIYINLLCNRDCHQKRWCFCSRHQPNDQPRQDRRSLRRIAFARRVGE